MDYISKDEFVNKIKDDNNFCEKWGELAMTNYWVSYGKNTNQLENVIEKIKTKPRSKKLIISMWDPFDDNKRSNNILIQFYVNDDKLSLQLYQRKAEIQTDIPRTIQLYSLFLCLIAHECGLQMGEFVYTLGEIYFDSMKLNDSRSCRVHNVKIKLNSKIKYIRDFTYEDIAHHIIYLN